MTSSVDPFGQPDCESEVRQLKDGYDQLFEARPFGDRVVNRHTYLIVGRRGSGKTTLSRAHAFKDAFGDPLHINVDEPTLFLRVLDALGKRMSNRRDVFVFRKLYDVWKFVIWTLLAEHTGESKAATRRSRRSPAKFISDQFERILDIYSEDVEAHVTRSRMSALLDEELLHPAQAFICARARERPIVLTIDTLERYDVSNEELMAAMAALVHFAADFNAEFADRALHLKVFMSGELFPYLKDKFLENSFKAIKSPVYLFWEPNDLLRLIGRRWHGHLRTHGGLPVEQTGAVDWADASAVMAQVWEPTFGRALSSGDHHAEERTFTYVLRHTQMRPRQLIVLCNAIANEAAKHDRVASFDASDIRAAVEELGAELAIETINSFAPIYPRVDAIVDALMNVPPTFRGELLDKRAAETQAEWPALAYTPNAFRALLAELGIVGLVEKSETDSVYARFEYSQMERLRLTPQDVCAIHPMFYRRLRVATNGTRVLPFGISDAYQRVLLD